MSPKAKDRATFSENDLCRFLVDTGNSRELAHFFMETLGDEGCEILRKRIVASERDRPGGDKNLASLLGITELSPEEQKALEINSLVNYFARRKELLARSISAVEAADLLGVSKQTIHDRIKEKKLIGLLEAKSMRLPIFQFDPAGQNGCVDGLPEVLQAMSGSLLSKISWLTSANAVFEGKAPIDVLKSGNQNRVLREARAVGVA
jgi:predicted DNA-binding protein YlxM (UPF0122 family)